MKILITSGATREPIDSVRFITNLSTGQTGATLADFLHEAGHDVEILCGEGSVRPIRVTAVKSFTSFHNLQTILKNRLGVGDLEYVVHAAAVSDYSVSLVENSSGNPLDHRGKLSSQEETLRITLTRNPKLIETLARLSPTPVSIIAFKLTDSKDPVLQNAAINQLLDIKGVTHVVHNDLSDIRNHQHQFHLMRSKEKIATALSAGELAQLIHTYVLRKSV